jgi:RimJ/RimL family protein N-acetyltransferase
MEPEDLEDALRWVNDREVTLWLTSLRYPMARKDEKKWFDDSPSNSFADGVRLAIETKDGKAIGSINLHRTHAEDRNCGLGIMIGEKDYWSNGYGTDAMLTLLKLAFEEMNLHRVWLHVFPDNERAVACYLKCGFREEGRLRQEIFQDGRYYDVTVMGVLRDEFVALQKQAS